jgi:hypothetical protein
MVLEVPVHDQLSHGFWLQQGSTSWECMMEKQLTSLAGGKEEEDEYSVPLCPLTSGPCMRPHLLKGPPPLNSTT